MRSSRLWRALPWNGLGVLPFLLFALLFLLLPTANIVAGAFVDGMAETYQLQRSFGTGL